MTIGAIVSMLKGNGYVKKVSAAVLAAVVAISLAGCGESEESIIQNSSPAQSVASDGGESKPAVQPTDNSGINASSLEHKTTARRTMRR